MSDIPVPSVAEAGAGLAWFNSQAGIVATVLAVFCIVLIVAIIFLFRSCKTEMIGAWVRVTEISNARQADALAMIQAIGSNTTALAVISAKVDIGERRSGR